MTMKNWVLIILVLFLSVSCKKEVIKEPKRLIAKEKMVDIMYDLSLLEAIRYQNPASVDSTDVNPTKFILKKYKVDSLQFSESNKYYASDYEGYKEMFDQISVRLEKEGKVADSLVKIEEKKAKKAVPVDSIKKVAKPINMDSLKPELKKRK